MRLITLGSLTLEGAELTRPRALALLTYLSLEGPTPRARLRELFWPEAADPALSMRVAISQLRKSLGPLLHGDDPLSLDLPCDAAELRGGAGGDPVDVLALYRGPFLHGVQLRDISPELEEWTESTREALAARAQVLTLRQAEAARSPAGRARLAEAAYRLTGLPPPGLPELRHLLGMAEPGSPLERELQVELAELSTRQQERLPLGEDEGGMLGRVEELNTLLGWLRAGARCVEINGSGGIGKSTLGRALLREAAPLLNLPAHLIDTEVIGTSAAAAGLVADGLGLRLDDRGDAWLALTWEVGEQPLLLLLDGTERLSDIELGVATLLDHCPNVRVLVTSRARQMQACPGSRGLTLRGLLTPPPGSDPALLRASSAVQLFARVARRFARDYQPEPAELPLVASLTRRLDGHPLAVTLAASWTREMPLSEVHDEVLRCVSLPRPDGDGANLHGGELRDGPAWGEADAGPDTPQSREFPHLPEIFARSRDLLAPEELHALARLAYFPDFTLSAGAQVLELSASVLAELERQSLVVDRRRPVPRAAESALRGDTLSRRRASRAQAQQITLPDAPDGDPAHGRFQHRRFQVVPVLARLALRELDAGELRALADRHADYYLARLDALEPGSSELEAELPNVLRALSHRLGGGAGGVGPQAMDRVMQHFDHTARYAGGMEALYGLRERAARAAPEVQAALTVGRAWLAHRSGLFRDATALVRPLTDDLRPELADARMKGFNIMAMALQQQGYPVDARTALEQALEMARHQGNSLRESMYLSNMSQILSFEGRYKEAQNLIDQTLALAVQAERVEQYLNTRLIQLLIQFEEEDREAQAIEKELAALIRALLDHQLVGLASAALRISAGLFLRTQRPLEALQKITELNRLTQEPAPSLHRLHTFTVEARVLLANQRSPQARRLMRLALEEYAVLMRRDNLWEAAPLVLAADLVGEHDPQTARTVLQAVIASPRTSAFERRRAAATEQALGLPPLPAPDATDMVPARTLAALLLEHLA